MKKTFFIFLLPLFLFRTVFAAGIAGQWRAQPDGQNDAGRTLNVRANGDAYYAQTDSPSQNIKSEPAAAFVFEEPALRFKIDSPGIDYRGVLGEDGAIEGAAPRKGIYSRMNFSRMTADDNRDFSDGFSYKEEKVYFTNSEDGVKLAGALSLPEGRAPFAAVIIVSGRDTRDRNGGILLQKFFLTAADYFIRAGFAVLRYDAAGAGSSSGRSASADMAAFAGDAKAAFDYLQGRKDIGKKKIGMIGHGHGAAIASMAAAEKKETAFLALLAAAGLPEKEIIGKRFALRAKASKADRKTLKRDLKINKKIMEIIAGGKDRAQQRKAVTEYLGKTFNGFKPQEMPAGMSRADFMRKYIGEYINPWTFSYLGYEPSDTLKKISCPVYAAFGGKDLTVPAKENLKAVKKALEDGGNEDVTAELFPELDHLFQEGPGAACGENKENARAFSRKALEKIVEWSDSKIK